VTLAELLQEVADKPDDCGRRLRLAAWYASRGEHDRAEFVRLQVEQLRFGRRTSPAILARARDLLAAHEGKWRTTGCSGCGGKSGSAGGKKKGTCLTCNGLGDAGGLVTISANQPFFTLPVEWRGGTPHAVVCKLFEAVAGDGSPTPWAVRVAENFPTVREFRLNDRCAFECEETGKCWLRAGDRDACEADAHRVPHPLLEVVASVGAHTHAKNKRGEPGAVAGLAFDSIRAAENALAIATGATARVAAASRR
jgi:uncharacterized protein (TIGR02996 family)